MTHQEAADLARRWHTLFFIEGNFDKAPEVVTEDFVAHITGRDFRGVDGVKEAAMVIRTAFPDVEITHHDVVSTEDRVAIRWTADGTHRGEYVGVPPTGKRIHVDGVDMFHIRSGKIAELWVAYDNLGMLQAMGAIPGAETERPVAMA
jgi:steroid delta-isomerase-like uncharacterized protein